MKIDKQEHIIEELQRILSECDVYIQTANNQETRLALHSISDQIKSITELLNEVESDSPLSKKECDILAHVSNGFTNREIASALSISVKTIEYHLKSIFSKTEASTRTEAVKNALVKKWI